MGNDEVKVNEVTEEAKKTETTVKAVPKKRGPKAKKTTAKKIATAKAPKADAETTVKAEPKKATVKRTSKRKTKTVKDPKTAAPVQAKVETKNTVSATYNFEKTVFEFGGKKCTEESVKKMVMEYLDKHPYIHVEKSIETFVNIDEGKLFFTIDGYGNADFTIDL